MGFCDHCKGQRFDRAQVLRALRASRWSAREADPACARVLALAIEAVRSLEIPHLEDAEELVDGEVIH
ncbi:MAG: hypothetical protein EXQ48_07155 [Acidobacteria bacterium]|nr:hypothetical protein [Acidobacteriota bacterium]